MYRFDLIKQSLLDLKADFIGFSFNLEGFFNKWVDFLFVIWIFALMFFIGKFIDRVFFEKKYSQKLQIFIRFALGYILISSSIFLLGFFSFLSELTIIIFLYVTTIFSFIELIRYPIHISITKKLFNLDIFKIISFLIILSAFLRIFPPEPAGDPLDYHLRFPRIYLHEQTMMIPPLGDESYTTVPHLPEMIYVISEMFTKGEMSRTFHFGFFLLIFFLLYNVNLAFKRGHLVGPLSAILFAISPLAFKISTSAFSDYFALLCVLISGYLLLENKKNSKNIMLSGILMGGAIASKLWIMYYFPFFILFLFISIKKELFLSISKKITIFCLSALSITGLWYIRGIILIGNPFYINDRQGQIGQEYPLLEMTLKQLNPNHLFNSEFRINSESILIYAGIVISLICWKKINKNINRQFLIFLVILLISSFFVPTDFALGRYTLPYQILIYIVTAFAISLFLKKFIYKILIFFMFAVFSFYYLFNSLIIVSYGLGWANPDNYLKRNLIKTTNSYYDFNHTFSKSITKNETIATYGLTEFYYAPFRYKNIYYFYNQKTHILLIPTNDIQKILMRGGNFQWFCAKATIKNCNDYDVSLITFDETAKQYLYRITMKK